MDTVSANIYLNRGKINLIDIEQTITPMQTLPHYFIKY